MNLLFKEFKNVEGVQLYYPKINNLIFRIVKDHAYNIDRDEQIILSLINDRLTDKSATIIIKYVTDLFKTDSGKVRSVISEI